MTDQRTCLYENHIALGAKMVSFGGFEMPLLYTEIAEEHLAVRKYCGVFDVSHMGEIRIFGKDAEALVQHIFTNDVSKLDIGHICYGMMLNHHGGTIDDLLVYKIDEKDFLLVVNAANIAKDDTWIRQHSKNYNAQIVNESEHYAQLAIQGPESEAILLEVLKLDGHNLDFYTFKKVVVKHESLLLSRTGYTGEDGFEIYGSAQYIVQAWNALINSSKVKPCGLGCRDTLRFEVGLPLYGDELTDDISPIMAGLSMFVKLDKANFIGKEIVERQKNEGVERKLIGIEIEGRAIPRHGYDVLSDDNLVIGFVTTGYHAISVDKSVCLALVLSQYGKLGNTVKVKIHRKLHQGLVVKKHFYLKHYKK